MVNSIKEYFLDIIYDKRNDPLAQIVKQLLLILSYIYGILVRLHHFFYKVKLLKSYKPKITILSIGNITLGGTGKTPFVMMLAEFLAQKNKKVGVLIRGYGEDEWKMLEDRLSKYGIKVFVGRDRVRSAKEAIREGFDTLLLDDGFQHRRLKRDVDIVLLDSTSPFGNRHLFPRGILREPLDSLKKADVFVLTKVNKGKNNVRAVENEIEKMAPGKKILKALHKPKYLFDLNKKETLALTAIKEKEVSILSAICDPSYFRYTVEETGARVGLEFKFPDHYPYEARDLKHIFQECKKKNISTIIATEKDAVKLDKLTLAEPKPQILILGIALEIIDEKEELDDQFNRLYMRHSNQNN